MTSIITGYEYDLFISYRQNDNHSGWVSEFVKHLEEEISATIKDHISIYFDENPHDGLHEHHEVDDSLKDKLKCLIFIPIVSQTYCDPNAFAWEHEFKVFVKQANNDQYGMKTRLVSGNVANRVLPIKIHDIDTDDVTLFESEVGGVMRSIDFIYKDTGVNRPLETDDHKNENLNKTRYIDQINKVANAIKEIISGIKGGEQVEEKLELPSTVSTPKVETVHKSKNKLILASIGILTILAFAYFIFNNKSKSVDNEMDKSIAVLPFVDMSPKKDQEYLGDGIAGEIITALSKIKDLKVIGRTSSFQFKGEKTDLREIGDNLKVSSIMEGSVMMSGNKIRITAQLIDVKDGSQIWSERYDRKFEDVLYLQSEIAEKVARELEAALTTDEEEILKKLPTKIPEAYNYYLMANFQLNKWNEEGFRNAMPYFEKAIEIDSDFVDAYVGLATLWITGGGVLGIFNQDEAQSNSRSLLLEALRLQETNANVHNILAISYFYYDWNFEKALEHFNRVKQITDHHGDFSMDFFIKTGKLQTALTTIEYLIETNPSISTIYPFKAEVEYFLEKKSMAIHTLNEAYLLFDDYFFLRAVTKLYYLFGEIDKSKTALEKLKNSFPDRPPIIFWLEGVHAFHQGKDATSYINQLKNQYNTNYSGSPAWFLALYHAVVGNKEAVFEWLEKSYERHEVEMTWLKMEPLLSPYNKDPRYQGILNKMNFPE